MNKVELLERLNNSIIGRSAWSKGVHSIAIMIVDSYYNDDSNLTIKDLLNGAQSVTQFVNGGGGLIYYINVINTLCTPSEKKRIYNKNGEIKERYDVWEWNIRATYQAFIRIAKVLGENTFNIKY